MIDTVIEVFESFGYEPLQTPVLELRETLYGKYGPDAEKLIYYAGHPGGEADKLAMRYDLTVPLARVFGLHESKITLPFRRYQIAPVWRADRPQRGRYREITQCDIDIVGIPGMGADGEVVNIVQTSLRRLGFRDVIIKINNRKLLVGIGQYAGLADEPLANLYRSIDKLDKIGVAGVRDEMLRGNIEAGVVDRIMDLLIQTRAETEPSYRSAEAHFRSLRQVLHNVPIAIEGLSELESLFEVLAQLGVPGNAIEFDASMVRGLSYYTGPIFEAMLNSTDPEERVGSVSGGGRYDDLLGIFRKQSLPTVGASLGIDRLIYLMEKRQSFPRELRPTVVEVLVTVFNAETRAASTELASALRAAGMKVELILEESKLGKQLGYASKKGIPFVAVLGPDEVASSKVKIKRLADQAEFAFDRDTAVSEILKLQKSALPQGT